jgi:hypothetical protein
MNRLLRLTPVILVLVPDLVGAQTCGLLPAGAVQVAIEVDRVEEDDPVVGGVRYFWDRFWIGAVVGNVTGGTTGTLGGVDDIGPYTGLVSAPVFGAGVEGGIRGTLGDWGICLTGSGRYGASTGATLEKSYSSGMYEKEELDWDTDTQRWLIDLSLDHGLGDIGSAGVGAFAQRSAMKNDTWSSTSFMGVSGGTEFLFIDHILAALGYRYPMAWIGPDPFEESGIPPDLLPNRTLPDGSLIIRLGWVW